MLIGNKSRILLLDTNLLLLLFIGAEKPKLIPKSRTLNDFKESDYDLLAEVIQDNFSSLVTTPHIMTEVSNLLGKERDDIKAAGREAMSEFLKKCDEITEKSTILVNHPEFMRLGLTDVAIAVAAEQSAFVLTADLDLDLYLHVSNFGLETVNFNHLRQGSWAF